MLKIRREISASASASPRSDTGGGVATYGVAHELKCEAKILSLNESVMSSI